MKPEDAEEYTQALGQVVAGGWRQIALGERLGVPEALGLTVGEWVQQRLGGYVKLSIPERREAVDELAAEGKKNTEIAAVLGVGESTVRRDRKSPNGESDGSREGIGDRDSPNGEPPPLHAAIRETNGAEEFDYLMGHVERIADVRALQADQPEKFAAIEIYDALRVAVDEAEHWRSHVDERYPGLGSHSEWLSLVRRLHEITGQLEEWTARVKWREEATV